MTSKKYQCGICGNEMCLCDVGHNLNINSLCHGHPSHPQLDPCETCGKEKCIKPPVGHSDCTQVCCERYGCGSPSQLDPLTELKEDALATFPDGYKAVALAFISRSFKAGEVSGAKRVVEKVEDAPVWNRSRMYDNHAELTEYGNGCVDDRGQTTEAARQVVVELEGKGI